MYNTIKNLHSYWAYFVILILVVAVINALIKRVQNKDYTDKDLRIFLFALVFSHLQLLIGLVLYFVSPMFELWGELGGEVMKNATARLYLVEHPLVNILAIVLITVGFSKHKKKETSAAKFKTILLMYLIAIVLLLSRIPWDAWPRL